MPNIVKPKNQSIYGFRLTNGAGLKYATTPDITTHKAKYFV
jgi:hypothetical protein